MNKKRKRHPSYGTALFKRGSYSGNSRRGVPLFGSTIKDHATTIRLSIHEADIEHDLGRDWIHGDLTPIVEVEMSAVQFTELLTTMNIGSGVPCTIRKRMRDSGGCEVIDDPPDDEIEAERVRDYMTDSMQTLADRLKTLTDTINEILGKRSLNKTDRETVASMTAKIVQDVERNFPYIAEQFQKAMDKSVAGAKAEIDATLTHAVTVVGLDVLRARNADQLVRTPTIDAIDVPRLPEGNDDDSDT